MTMNTRNTEDSEQHLNKRIRDALDEEVLDLGEDIHMRLAAARRSAVAAMDRPGSRVLSPWVPTAAVATTVLAVGMLSFRLAPPELPLYGGEEAQLAAQNMELLSQMEFVAWMVEEAELNAG